MSNLAQPGLRTVCIPEESGGRPGSGDRALERQVSAAWRATRVPGKDPLGSGCGAGTRAPGWPGAPSARLAQPHWARRLWAPPPGSVVSMAAAAFVVPRVKQKAGATRRGSEERG